MRKAGLCLAALLLLTACTGQGTDPPAGTAPREPGPVEPRPDRTIVYTAEDVIGALTARRFAVRTGDSGMDNRVFRAPYQDLIVGGETMRVYLYPDAETAWRTVDLDGCHLFTASGPAEVGPAEIAEPGQAPGQAPGSTCRNVRPGNLIIRMAFTDAALADRIAAALLDWAGPEPGETPSVCATAAGRRTGSISPTEFVMDLMQTGVPAALTGEWRPGGPGGQVGMVLGTPHGRYLIYPSDPDAPPPAVPLFPTGRGATAWISYGNLLVALESESADGVLKLEEPVQSMNRPDLSPPQVMEQAFGLAFLRPAGWTPSQSLGGPTVRTWALDETLVLNRWTLQEARQIFGSSNGLYSLEQMVSAILPVSAGGAGREARGGAATMAGMPALRLLFREPGGDERALWVARRGPSYYALLGPAPVADRVACSMRQAGSYPYTMEQVRSRFVAAGIDLPKDKWEWTMDGHTIRLSMGEPERQESAAGASGHITLGSERQWLAGNVAVYGAFDAPETVQERLRTALAPLAAGRGRAVWEYGCSRAEQEGPITGGVTTFPSRVTLCARTQPATFSLLVPPDRLNEPVQLEFSALRPDETDPIVSIIWQWQNGLATRISDTLPFVMDLPTTDRPGSFSITVTGHGPVAIRIRPGQR